MSKVEILYMLLAILIGALSSVAAGTLTTLLRALRDERQRDALRSRTFIENVRHILA